MALGDLGAARGARCVDRGDEALVRGIELAPLLQAG